MNFAEANRKYFDSVSDSYDAKPWWAKVNAQVSSALRSDLDWIGIPFTTTTTDPSTQVRLLDYACGTGLMTRVFGPYVTRTKGIDISPNMVSTYNTRAKDAEIAEDVVHAVTGDLFDKTNPSPVELSGEEWQGFDLATVGFGFHHFEDVVYAARQLKERLRPGGVLVINDFLEGGDSLAGEDGQPIVGSEGNHAVHGVNHGHGHGHGHLDKGHDHGAGHEHSHDHSHGHTHDHHHHDHHKQDETKNDIGDSIPEFKKKMEASIVVPHFTISGVKDFFTEAGFVDVDVIVLKEKSYMEFAGKKLWRTILLAKGRRPEVEAGKSEL